MFHLGIEFSFIFLFCWDLVCLSFSDQSLIRSTSIKRLKQFDIIDDSLMINVDDEISTDYEEHK